MALHKPHYIEKLLLIHSSLHIYMPGGLPPNVCFVDSSTRLATKNLTPTVQVYGERLIIIDGIEYRLWSPHRSKLAAMVEKRMVIPMRIDSKVLYLGGAAGTTASHVSDIVREGRVFVVEFSSRAMRDLISVCTQRRNMVPILADAAHPAVYRAIVEKVDVIYQDVAQPHQAEIALANANEFLRPGGYLIMVIKARSINSTASPKQVFAHELEMLKAAFDVLETKDLKPFDADHLALVAQCNRRLKI
jgi:fibrillarin-like pre-rRNA processing protein